MRKTVFNFEIDEVVIHYHFKEGQIFRKPKYYNRSDLLGQGKSNDINEKESDESKEQQEFNKINVMEQKCHA